VEPDDLESLERPGALVVHTGDADAAEREAREGRARQRQVEAELVRGRDLARLHVEVLDAALRGVVEEAPELRGLEFADVDDEGEAVEPSARARFVLQRVQLPPRVVAGAEVHLEGGAVRPPALPQVAPPVRERPRADGVLEREVRQDALPQLVR